MRDAVSEARLSLAGIEPYLRLSPSRRKGLRAIVLHDAEPRLKDGDFTDCGSGELCWNDPPCDFHDRDLQNFVEDDDYYADEEAEDADG